VGFVIFDIWALWRSALSVRVLSCQQLQMTASTSIELTKWPLQRRPVPNAS